MEHPRIATLRRGERSGARLESHGLRRLMDDRFLHGAHNILKPLGLHRAQALIVKIGGFLSIVCVIIAI